MGAVPRIRLIIGNYDGREVFDSNPYPLIDPMGKEDPVRAHRYIMEHELGRSLSSQEHVHHIDGNQKNFSPDNLVVLMEKEHHSRHKRKKKGTVLYCIDCGEERYYPLGWITRYYGDAKEAQKWHRCRKCYYKSKRWIKKKKGF